MMKYFILFAFCFAVLSGCGVSTVPVAGTVHLDGVPIAECRVVLKPKKDGVPAVGVTDEQGRFTLQTLEEKPVNGVVPGNYTALFSWYEPDGMDEYSGIKPPFNLPSRYSNEGLPVEILKRGNKDLAFELTP